MGIPRGGELSGTMEVRTVAVLLMRGTSARMETLLYGVHEVVVRVMLFLRRELEECKEGITRGARYCGGRRLRRELRSKCWCELVLAEDEEIRYG